MRKKYFFNSKTGQNEVLVASTVLLWPVKNWSFFSVWEEEMNTIMYDLNPLRCAYSVISKPLNRTYESTPFEIHPSQFHFPTNVDQDANQKAQRMGILPTPGSMAGPRHHGESANPRIEMSLSLHTIINSLGRVQGKLGETPISRKCERISQKSALRVYMHQTAVCAPKPRLSILGNKRIFVTLNKPITLTERDKASLNSQNANL